MIYKEYLSAVLLSSFLLIGSSVFAEQLVSVPDEACQSSLNIYYVNDTHGDLVKFGKLITKLNEIKKTENLDITLVSTQGDMYIGRNHKRNSAMTKLMNIGGVELFTLGNHEFDDGSFSLAKELKRADFKTIVSNMTIPQGNVLSDLKEEGKLFSSVVIDKNNEKYGIIGAAPINVNLGLFDKKSDAVSVLNPDETIAALNKEVELLEKQGINKIILISHLGYFGEEGDLHIARQTQGIDVILGGHTHLEIDGIQTADKDKTHLTNLVNSKRGEPVVIVQTNGGANDIGNLKVSFDKNGIIDTDVKNGKLINSHIRIEQSNITERKIEKIVEKALGKNKVVAVVKTPYISGGTREERNTENPTANLLCDSIYSKVKGKNPDVVLVHSPTVRGGLVDEITTYQVKYSMLPFNGDIFYVELSEQDFVNLLNVEAMTSINTSNSQILQVHGMKYTVDKTIENPTSKGAICVKNIVFLDKNNNEVRRIDEKNPSSTATVKCSITGYLFLDERTKDILKGAKNIQFVGKEHDIVLKYLKKQKQIDAVREGRLTVIEKK